jgi:hypothetical protein
MACGQLAPDQITIIHEMAANGAAAGVIRARLGAAIQLDKLYNEMRKARKTIPSEVDELMQELKNWTGWEIRTNWNAQPNQAEGSLAEMFSVHRRIAGFPFSQQVVIMDDAFCTNHFNIPVVAVIIPNCNVRNQPLGFGYLFDRSQESFEHFLTFLKTLAKYYMLCLRSLPAATGRHPWDLPILTNSLVLSSFARKPQTGIR